MNDLSRPTVSRGSTLVKAEITVEKLRELLRYDPETGVFTWKVRPSIRVKAIGAEAGHIAPDGYRIITFANMGGPKRAHRLAWLYVHGEWPKQEIDHINGDRADNRIVNLRNVDRSTNMENRKRANKNNRAGLLGALWHETYKKWYSSITVHGSRHFLGLFHGPEEAHKAYLTAKRKLHAGNTI